METCGGGGAFLLLLALLLCALATCWSFAEEASGGDGAYYGDRAPVIPDRRAVPDDAELDGRNLAEAIDDASLRRATEVEAAANLAGPATDGGVPDLDRALQARLEEQERREPPAEPEARVARPPVREIAQGVMDASIAAAEPAPPRFQPLDDLLPTRVFDTTWSGCAPFFTDSKCDFYKPAPRLHVQDLDELAYARALQRGLVNLVEPLEARQAQAQFLMEGVRSRKDAYTRASMTNDTAFGTCQALQRRTPDFVVF
jgi:hypothetical protein